MNSKSLSSSSDILYCRAAIVAMPERLPLPIPFQDILVSKENGTKGSDQR